LESRGLGNQQATALYDVAEKLEKGTKIEELSQKEQEALRKSFVTEGKQLTELQKTQRSLIEGLSQIGQGLIKILTGLLGTLIVGIKNLPGAISAAILSITNPEAGFKALEAIGKRIDNQLEGMGEGVKLVVAGGTKVGSTLGNAMGDVGSKLMSAIKEPAVGAGFGLGDVVNAVSDLIEDNNQARDRWLEELQASFNQRIDSIAEALRLISPEERKELQRADSDRLSAMYAGARIKADIQSKHLDKSESKRKNARVK